MSGISEFKVGSLDETRHVILQGSDFSNALQIEPGQPLPAFSVNDGTRSVEVSAFELIDIIEFFRKAKQ